MTAADILHILEQQFGSGIARLVEPDSREPAIRVTDPHRLPEICAWLRDTPPLRFDMLACLSGVDDGETSGTIRVVYHLQSILEGHSIRLEVITDRNQPLVASVSSIWRAADWHEREAFDMFGIRFDGHPDLRRILLANDWEGYPLRKDYQPAESYHGIRIAYTRPDGK